MSQYNVSSLEMQDKSLLCFGHFLKQTAPANQALKLTK
jgi:hypothetical protein